MLYQNNVAMLYKIYAFHHNSLSNFAMQKSSSGCLLRLVLIGVLSKQTREFCKSANSWLMKIDVFDFEGE
jgi:hypothetical protein